MSREKQDFIETWARYCGAPKEIFIGHLDILIKAETLEIENKNERLKIALFDAINRPLGVLPDSASEFLSEINIAV